MSSQKDMPSFVEVQRMINKLENAEEVGKVQKWISHKYSNEGHLEEQNERLAKDLVNANYKISRLENKVSDLQVNLSDAITLRRRETENMTVKSGFFYNAEARWKSEKDNLISQINEFQALQRKTAEDLASLKEQNQRLLKQNNQLCAELKRFDTQKNVQTNKSNERDRELIQETDSSQAKKQFEALCNKLDRLAVNSEEKKSSLEKRQLLEVKKQRLAEQKKAYETRRYLPVWMPSESNPNMKSSWASGKDDFAEMQMKQNSGIHPFERDQLNHQLSASKAELRMLKERLNRETELSRREKAEMEECRRSLFERIDVLENQNKYLTEEITTLLDNKEQILEEIQERNEEDEAEKEEFDQKIEDYESQIRELQSELDSMQKKLSCERKAAERRDVYCADITDSFNQIRETLRVEKESRAHEVFVIQMEAYELQQRLQIEIERKDHKTRIIRNLQQQLINVDLEREQLEDKVKKLEKQVENHGVEEIVTSDEESFNDDDDDDYDEEEEQEEEAEEVKEERNQQVLMENAEGEEEQQDDGGSSADSSFEAIDEDDFLE